MKDPSQRGIAGPDITGGVGILARCTPEQIRTFSFSAKFGTYAQYKSLYTRRESLEKQAGQPDANVVLALAQRSHIVGFGVLARPDSDERWTELGPGVMMELKVIEVSRNWRSRKIASRILEEIHADPAVEKMIAYMVGYSWTWDLDGAGVTALQYRGMLIRLFEPFGYKEYQTNEPNIWLKPENLFMARIGTSMSAEMRTRFKWLCFGMSP